MRQNSIYIEGKGPNMRYLVLLICLSGMLAICPAKAFSLEIQWRLENPFRFFIDAELTDAHRKAALAVGPTKSPVLAAERLLSLGTRHGWAEGAFLRTGKATCQFTIQSIIPWLSKKMQNL